MKIGATNPPLSGDEAELLDAILRERGGIETFSVVGLAVAKSLASALLANAPPGIIAGLSAMLPVPTPKIDGDKWDLTLLSNKQLDHLEYLCNIACGRKAEKRKLSHAELWVGELVWIINKCERESRELSDGEQHEVRNSIGTIIRTVFKSEAHELWRVCFECRGWIQQTPAEQKAAAERQLGAPSENIPDSERNEAIKSPVGAPTPAKVVALPQRSIHDHHNAPLKTYDEPWR
jgi:hypothetical protein